MTQLSFFGVGGAAGAGGDVDRRSSVGGLMRRGCMAGLQRVRECGGREQHNGQEAESELGRVLTHVGNGGAENTRAKLRLMSSLRA